MQSSLIILYLRCGHYPGFSAHTTIEEVVETDVYPMRRVLIREVRGYYIVLESSFSLNHGGLAQAIVGLDLLLCISKRLDLILSLVSTNICPVVPFLIMGNDQVIDKPKDNEVLARIDIETAEGECVVLDSTQTHRGLKSRHSQMIALGGTIGTGLFVGSGQALRIGGPGLLLAAYVTLSVFAFGIVTATTELSAYLCLPGSTMPYFGNRFFSRSMGFALGWMHWYFCVITVPAEITASSVVIDYWNLPSSINVGVWITIMVVVIVALNFCSVSVYGETEFWFASIKVFGIVGLLLMAIIITSGGTPSGHVMGFTYWNDPGAANEYLTTGGAGRLCAYIGATCFSGFAFLFAPELLVITSGEMKDPRINIPKAGKRYIIRVVIFYVLGAFFLGMIIPSNDPELLGGGNGAGASPWAIAAKVRDPCHNSHDLS